MIKLSMPAASLGLRTVALSSLLCLSPLPGFAKEESAAMGLARQLNQAFIEVADQVSPSVVVIRVAHKPEARELDESNPLWEMLPPQFRRQYEERFERRKNQPDAEQEPIFDGQGSGVVIRPDGFILTNRHVVDGADRIKVKFRDGREFDAEVKGVDAKSDIAVIKIEAKGLPAAKLGDSDKTRVGEFAIAIGAPFELDYSVTFGHISAKGRNNVIPSFMEGGLGAAMDQDFLQTDASINPGNSGGPLINIDGEVIGVNTLIRGLHTGIGFAIPANLAREVSDQLIADGRFTRAWLGISIRALSDYADFKKLAPGAKEGVVVLGITPKGPAAKSELKPSDLITAVDGKPIATAQQLRNEVRSKKIGAPVTLDVVRSEKTLQIKLKTEEWPDDATPVANRDAAPDEKGKSLGLTVQTLTKELAQKYEVEMADGIIVTAVDPGSAAHRVGIKVGDIITEMNHQAVTSPKQFREAVKNGDVRKGIIVNLVSEGAAKFEILKDRGD